MNKSQKIVLNKRRNDLFGVIVRDYIKTAEPVGSKRLCEEYGLDCSSATIRNEMMALEKAGLLRQPHTSAGRVPTEAGYQYYVEHCLTKRNIESLMQGLSEVVRTSDDIEVKIKQLAKELAQSLNEGVFIRFGSASTYYTGLSYLFSQPEFESYNLVCEIGKIFDKLDEVADSLFKRDNNNLNIFIGKENPFGDECAVVYLPFEFREEKRSIIGVLGPMRMNYDLVVSIMKEIGKIL